MSSSWRIETSKQRQNRRKKKTKQNKIHESDITEIAVSGHVSFYYKSLLAKIRK